MKDIKDMTSKLEQPQFQVLDPIDPPMSTTNISFEQKTIKKLIDEAYTQGKEDEQKRVEKVLDSFIVEDEFYGKGLMEIQTELIIKAIKIQLNQLSKEQGKL